MSDDHLDMECPNCGHSFSSDASSCPFCHVDLKMADLDELERVSREDYVPEEPASKYDAAHFKNEPLAVDQESDDNHISFRGRFFNRGKK